MKTCLIYGDMSIDLDIVLNLKAFYEGLGFTACFCLDRVRDADLLVILRATNRPIDLGIFHHFVIHIYDYDGDDIDKFLRSTIDYKKTYIFCPSDVKRGRVLKQTPSFPADHVFTAFAPVEISLWTPALEDVKYELVHIGNHKPVPAEEDIFSRRFHEAVSALKADVWGADWKGFVGKGRYHGKSGYFETPHRYVRSRFALGLMYPFQRPSTFSGRFWEAPLNGCQVLSEPGFLTRVFPGVVETDYTLPDLREKMKGLVDREALRARAKEFWETEYQRTLSYVRPTLEGIKERTLGTGESFFFMWISAGNLVREYFHTKFVPNWLRTIVVLLRDRGKRRSIQSKVPTLKDNPEPPAT